MSVVRLDGPVIGLGYATSQIVPTRAEAELPGDCQVLPYFCRGPWLFVTATSLAAAGGLAVLMAT